MLTTFQNKSLNTNDEPKIASATKRLARATERLDEARAMLRRVTDDRELGMPADLNHVKILEANVIESESLVESLTAELDAAKRAPVERAEFDKKEAGLFPKACASKTRKERLAADLIAAFKDDESLAAEFRSTVLTTERGYLQLRDGRFKRAGGCWPAIFEDTALVETLKRFLRDAAECKVS
jgi:hypothetical protein